MATTSIELSHPQRDVRNPASPLLRLRVVLRRGALDRQLAEGRDPATDPRLAVRAGQLRRPAVCAGVSLSLLNALRSIETSSNAWYPRPNVPVDAVSVRACSSELRDLACALMDIDPRPRGVAIARLLTTDGAGPLYVNGPPEQLRRTLVSARLAL